MTGGVVTALVVLTLGSLLRLALPWWAWAGLLATWFVVIAVREIGLVSFRLPQNARLVPETVFRHGRLFGPFEFGFEMGTGVRTYVTSGLPYVAVPVVALFAGPLGAVLTGVGWGLGRQLMTAANLRYSPDGDWDLAFDDHGALIRRPGRAPRRSPCPQRAAPRWTARPRGSSSQPRPARRPRSSRTAWPAAAATPGRG